MHHLSKQAREDVLPSSVADEKEKMEQFIKMTTEAQTAQMKRKAR